MGSRNFPEAAQWIREHRANRRNVTKEEARLLWGREYNAAKKSESERAKLGGRPSGKTKGQDVPKIKSG